MIDCVRRAFPGLSEVSASRVSVAQVFPELGEGLVEISRDMWKDVLSLVKITRVLVSKGPLESTVLKKRRAQTVEKESGPATSTLDLPVLNPTIVKVAAGPSMGSKGVPTAGTVEVGSR
ncbi:hypothetical protein FRC11_014179, partial [Ceratobasidium sp. 423]